MGFLGRGLRLSVAVFPLLTLGLLADSACYDTGDGRAPPLDQFYFPVGLKVSHGGSVLYAVNSNFDLQYSGGTLQSYDLRAIRQDALRTIEQPPPGCPGNPPILRPGDSVRQPLGETCAPPKDSRGFVRDSAIIGAFATELLLSAPPSELVPRQPKAHATDEPAPAGDSKRDRLFIPVRGNATLTWASVDRDDFTSASSGDGPQAKNVYSPFKIECGQDATNRCDSVHEVGEDPNEPGNTRHLTLPGEPFAAAFSEDGESIVVTHQNETKTTLFSTGLSRSTGASPAFTPEFQPAIEFTVDKIPTGGVGIVPVPHDRDAFLGALKLPLPAFLETSRSVAAVSLIRRYTDDQGGVAVANAVGSSISRPFLDVEGAFPITASAGGTDSRGIVVDPSPRLACKARVGNVGDPGGPVDLADLDAKKVACARKPARVFIANRSPASLLVGDVGLVEGASGAYDADRLTIHTSVPLSAGPSKVYLAPVVARDGTYALRVFIVCFDSATVFIYDPDGGVIENVLRVAPGPFAMAFDPFSLDEVARHATVPIDARDANIKRYRFAYLASFTQSFVQVVDLDNSVPYPITFEKLVYTLGTPTNPKGT